MLRTTREPRHAAPVAAGLATAETLTALTLAHSAAGGTLPGAGSLLVLAVLVYGAGLAVLGRRLPIRYAAPGLVLVQVVLHGWLVALTPVAGHAAHATHATHAAAPDAGAPLGLSWSMLLAHSVAGLCAALSWWLRRRAVAVVVHWAQLGEMRPTVVVRPRVAGAARFVPGVRLLALAPTRGPPSAHTPLPA